MLTMHVEFIKQDGTEEATSVAARQGVAQITMLGEFLWRNEQEDGPTSILLYGE